ncbi:MAG: GNAT family N-acetyltransferase [Candidatus Thorarchaeota archaeon]
MVEIRLKKVKTSDLDFFFQHMQDKKAQYMAAFIPEDPSNRKSFDNHWNRLLSDKDIIARTIYYEGSIIGHVAKFVLFDRPEITYWIDRDYWGRGIAGQAVQLFLDEVEVRPIYARAAKDNSRSIRVLEKCGFSVIGYDKYYANARGKEIVEVILRKG